jgi:hypothetical protein
MLTVVQAAITRYYSDAKFRSEHPNLISQDLTTLNTLELTAQFSEEINRALAAKVSRASPMVTSSLADIQRYAQRVRQVAPDYVRYHDEFRRLMDEGRLPQPFDYDYYNKI